MSQTWDRYKHCLLLTLCSAPSSGKWPCSLGKREVWALVPQRAGLWCHIPHTPLHSSCREASEMDGAWGKWGREGWSQARMLGASLFVHCRELKPQSKRSQVGRGFEEDKWLTQGSQPKNQEMRWSPYSFLSIPGPDYLGLSLWWSLLFYATLVGASKTTGFGV